MSVKGRSSVPECVACLYHIGWGIKRIVRHTGIPKTTIRRFAKARGLTDDFLSSLRKEAEDKRRAKHAKDRTPKPKASMPARVKMTDDERRARARAYYYRHHERNKASMRRRAKIDYLTMTQGGHEHIKRTLRSRIYNAITRLTGTRPPRNKELRTTDLIGCSIDRLRAHLEFLWKPGMTWENYGEWHVDHRIPCNAFDLTNPVRQRECFHWSNLQPLWAAENIAKSDTVTDES